MTDLNGGLIDLAYIIVVIGFGAIAVWKYFPYYWQQVFPTSQQKLESEIQILEDDNLRLETYRKTLEDLKKNQDTHKNLITQVNQLEKETGRK